MRCISRWGRVVVVAAAALSAVGAGRAGAEIHSDRATAIVTWPLLRSFDASIPPGSLITVIASGHRSRAASSKIRDPVSKLRDSSGHLLLRDANSHCSTARRCLRATTAAAAARLRICEQG